LILKWLAKKLKKPHHTARAGLTYNKIRMDTMKFSHSAITAQLTQDFEKENPYLVDDKDWPYIKYQKTDAICELIKDFFDPIMTLLDQNKRI
jgi:hypothetical protein